LFAVAKTPNSIAYVDAARMRGNGSNDNRVGQASSGSLIRLIVEHSSIAELRPD
jgi:hypothetical protein